jgi:hypothetical protein
MEGTGPKINLFLSELYTVGQSYKDCNPGLRWGQCLMLALYDINIDYYKEIVGTDVDPFHSDGKIPAFEAKLNSLKSK